ncbi:MAG: hypothetical protein U0Q16_04000 [Bryobacteraceae bacterium]
MKKRRISSKTRAAIWAGLMAWIAYSLVAAFTAFSQMPAGEAFAVALRGMPFAGLVGVMVFGIVLLIQQPAFDRDNFSHVAEPLLLHYPDKLPENETKPVFGSVRIEHRSQTIAEMMTGRTDFPSRFSSGADGVRVVTLSYGNAVFVPWSEAKLEATRLWKAVEVRMDCIKTPTLTVAMTIPEEGAAALFPNLAISEAPPEQPMPAWQWLAIGVTVLAAVIVYRLL